MTRSFMHSATFALLLLLLLLVPGTYSAPARRRVDIPGSTPTEDESFVGAVFEESRNAVDGPLYLTRLFKERTWESILRTAYYTSNAENHPMQRSDSLLHAPRSAALRQKPGFPSISTGADEKGHVVVGAFATTMADYYMKTNNTEGENAATMWPFFYLYPDFVRDQSYYVRQHRRLGVIDVDSELMKLLSAGAVDELLLLTYNEWESNALHGLSVLQEVPCLYGGGLYDEVVDWEGLPGPWKRAMKKLGVSGSSVMKTVDGGFSVLVEGRYPQSPDDMPKIRRCPTKTFLLFPRMDAEKVGWRDVHVKNETVHMVGAMRMNWRTGVEYSLPRELRPTGISPAISMVRYNNNHDAVVDNQLPVTQDTTTDDVMKFLVRHTDSSLYLGSFYQLTQLVEDFGKVAVLLLSEENMDAMGDNNMSMHRGLRKKMPFFVVEVPEMNDPITGWDSLHRKPEIVVSPDDLFDPMAPNASVNTAATLSSKRTAVVSVIETPTRRPGGNYEVANWVVRDIRIPMPSAETDFKHWEKLVGSRIQDILTKLEEEETRVHDIAHGESLQKAMLRPNYDVVDAATELLLVVDNFDKEDETGLLSCGEQLRSFVLAGADGTSTASSMRYGVIQTEARRLQDELMHAATPRHTTADGATPCRLPIASLDPSCVVYCVSGSGTLSRWVSTPEEKTVMPALEGVHPIEHISNVDVHAALEEVLNGVMTTKNGKQVRSTVRHTEHTHAPWYMLLPDEQATPVVIYDLAKTNKKKATTTTTGMQFIYLTDSSCALTANYAKAINLLQSCYRSKTSSSHAVHFTHVDVMELPSMDGIAEVPQALLREHYLSRLDKLKPPQILVFNGTHALATLSTLSYAEQKSWFAAVTGFVSIMDKDFDWDATESCARALLDEEKANREAFRQALRRPKK